jgi:hypothetical protein
MPYENALYRANPRHTPFFAFVPRHLRHETQQEKNLSHVCLRSKKQDTPKTVESLYPSKQYARGVYQEGGSGIALYRSFFLFIVLQRICDITSKWYNIIMRYNVMWGME